MPYPNRIIIYLKGPSGNTAATMNALAFTNPNTMVKETDLIKTGLKPVKSGEEVAFVLRTTKGICDVYGLMITWPGGCRITVQTLLGEKGNGVSDAIGVDYDRTSAADPCDIVYCRFNGSGVLTYEDRQGVIVTMDTCKPGVSGLCLTLTPRPGCNGSVVFPGRQFADLSV